MTSYNELRREALEVDRWNRLHPAEPERRPYLLQALDGVEVAASTWETIVSEAAGLGVAL